MHGYENNYHVMEWYLNNWDGRITAEQSKANAGRSYTNHYAIAVSAYHFVLLLNYFTSLFYIAVSCLFYLTY
jgi:hypothetical protein